MRDFTTHPRLRVAALVVCAAGTWARGFAYVGQDTNTLLGFIDSVVPLHVWSWAWMTVGVLVLGGVIDRVIARWALAASASLWGTWALSYTLAWLIEGADRGWVTAAAMAQISAFMWIFASLMDATGPPYGPRRNTRGSG